MNSDILISKFDDLGNASDAEGKYFLALIVHRQPCQTTDRPLSPVQIRPF